jgi:predicted ArsR family transcriptional regulator
MGIAELAEALGIHVNTVRFHLDKLAASGQVERVEPARGTPGRPALQFRAVRRMSADGPRQFQMLAAMLTRGLAGVPDGAKRAREAGAALGRELAEGLSEEEAAGGLTGFLDRLGFGAQMDGTEIRLYSCPFLEVAQVDQSIVCQAHLGLMRGAARRWDATTRVTGLTPFVEPDLCSARIQSGART